MREGPLLLLLLACGPGPTTEPATPAPISTTKVTPTKPVESAHDCNARAMEKLVGLMGDAGTRGDLDASVEQDDVQPADATAAVTKLAPQLRACNPSELEGCAFFTTTVAKEGNVTAVDTFVSDALPRDVVDCLAGVLKGARFAPVPKAGKMTVPVTFSRH